MSLATHTLHGRAFRVVADFPDSDAGIKAANDYMVAHLDTGLLDIANGRCILSKLADKGRPVVALTARQVLAMDSTMGALL